MNSMIFLLLVECYWVWGMPWICVIEQNVFLLSKMFSVTHVLSSLSKYLSLRRASITLHPTLFSTSACCPSLPKSPPSTLKHSSELPLNRYLRLSGSVLTGGLVIRKPFGIHEAVLDFPLATADQGKSSTGSWKIYSQWFIQHIIACAGSTSRQG